MFQPYTNTEFWEPLYVLWMQISMKKKYTCHHYLQPVNQMHALINTMEALNILVYVLLINAGKIPSKLTGNKFE